ncbi:tail protein [Vibrio phage K394]
MTSLFSNTLIDEMNSDNPKLIIAVEILYKSDPVRVHTSTGDVVIGGQTYTGVGALGGIDPVKQSANNGPATLNLSLTGLDPTLVAATLNERTAGSKVKIMVCSLDDDYKVNSASIIFAGRVSTQRFAYGQEMSIEVEIVDRLADWQRKGSRRFDQESHTNEQPGDDYFRFIAQMSEKPLYWGSSQDAPPFNYG